MESKIAVEILERCCPFVRCYRLHHASATMRAVATASPRFNSTSGWVAFAVTNEMVAGTAFETSENVPSAKTNPR